MNKFIIGAFFFTLCLGGLATDTAQAATAPVITSMVVNPDGWTVDVTIAEAYPAGNFSGLNNKFNPTLEIDVTSRSFSSTGATTSSPRKVYATAIKRKPYPQQLLREEVIFATGIVTTLTLSEYVYSDDVIINAHVSPGFFTNSTTSSNGLGNLAQDVPVTNYSNEKYPLPQAVWLQHDLDIATTTFFSPKLAVMHRFGQSGQPVRAVKFIATDEHGNRVTNTTSTLSAAVYASGNFANYFSAALNFSALTAGDLVSINAIVYPWVGDSFEVAINGDVYPSPNITVLKILNNHNLSYGTAYAYVDGGISTSTKAVSANPEQAINTPFPTIAAAASAIQLFNSANYGRNNIGGGVVRIMASTTIVGLGTDTMDTVLTDGKVPLILEGVDRYTSVYMNATTSINNDIPGLLKVRNITLKKNGASITAFDGKNKIDNALIFEDVTFDSNGQAAYAGWMIQFGRGYFINNTGQYVRQGDIFSSNIQSTVLTLGSTFFQSTAYNVISCTGNQNILQNNKQLGLPKGSLHAWNFASLSSASANVAAIGGTSAGAQGTALVGNIFEQYNAAPAQSALHISADSNITENENMIDYANTVVGQRSNVFYQDKGTTTVSKKGLTKHSVHYRRNTKSDIFGLSSNLTGNWAIRYGVGAGYSLVIDGESSGKKTPSAASWLGEIIAVGERFTGLAKFRSDKSTMGDKTGRGDYTPENSSEIPLIPAGETYFATDLFGTPIPLDGSARAGAVQSK